MIHRQNSLRANSWWVKIFVESVALEKNVKAWTVGELVMKNLCLTRRILFNLSFTNCIEERWDAYVHFTVLTECTIFCKICALTAHWSRWISTPETCLVTFHRYRTQISPHLRNTYRSVLLTALLWLCFFLWKDSRHMVERVFIG